MALAAKPGIEDVAYILNLAVEGKIKPVIDRCFSLRETADAVYYVKNKHAQGKVIITVK